MKESSNYIQKLFSLENKVAVLTGGIGMLGTEFAHALAYAGARIAILDISDKPTDRLKLLSENFPIIFIKADITREDEIERALGEIEKKWGTPNILINNAGWKASPSDTKGAGAPFENYSMELWDKVFAINVGAAAKCSKIFGSRMLKNKNGIIINISSIYGLVSPDQRIYEYRGKKDGVNFVKDASYSASKAALVALTRDLATLWAPNGIRVNALALGGVENSKSDKEFIKNYSDHTPLGRMARPDEYNAALLFLASDASSYITGTTLIVDGGWTAW